jgi:hypothetical protein
MRKTIDFCDKIFHLKLVNISHNPFIKINNRKNGNKSKIINIGYSHMMRITCNYKAKNV